jgi:integrase
VSPHTLRRGFSTLFLHINPGDLFRLQHILGHADISTTRAYLREAQIPEIRDALDRPDLVQLVPRTPVRFVTVEERRFFAPAERRSRWLNHAP